VHEVRRSSSNSWRGAAPRARARHGGFTYTTEVQYLSRSPYNAKCSTLGSARRDCDGYCTVFQ
jgi:hypothetical protein